MGAPFPKRQPDGQGSGFTIVELLVAIAIIGVLISVLLPAVQSARDSARKLNCASNTKQLALALQNYESAHGRLPPSGLVDTIEQTFAGRTFDVFDQRSGRMLSWIVVVLPYLEEQSLYDQFDLSRSVLDQPLEPQAAVVPSLLCPSDSAADKMFRDDELTSGKTFAKGNYAAWVSPFHTDLQMLYPGPLIVTGQPLKNITDGIGKTLVISEVRTLDRLDDERGAWALPWNGATLLAFDMHHSSVEGGYFNVYTISSSSAYQSQTPNTPGPNRDVLLKCAEEAAVQADLERLPCLQWDWGLGLWGYISAAPRSLHLGGVNAAFLDGRVEFLTNDIDPIAMSQMIGINDGNYIPPTASTRR